MSELRRLLLDGVDNFHREHDGETPDHCILPTSIEDDVRLEKLDLSREFFVVSEKHRGLMGIQVWFSKTLDDREKGALLLSDSAFATLFTRTEDFYTGNPYYVV